STGAVLAYITSFLMMNQPIKKLQESYVRIQETVVAAERVFEIIDNVSTVKESQNPIPFPKNWSKIAYKNVSFKYGSEWILKNISVEIQKGQSVAFVGESGSGKSTIVNLLERFYDPVEGEILIDDTNINQFGLQDLRKNVALVSQDVFLFSDTIENNIHAGDFSKSKETIVEKAKHANAHNFILKTEKGYQSAVGDRGALLSGGEKQRISLARAFFKDASILILDEATSALDSSSEKEVQKGIDELMIGRTSIVIAHRLSTIQNCDRIYVIQKGEIVEQGKFSDLVDNKGEFAKFYHLQS
ncbi:MAG: ATP-binding cassette domain-containing protein, partial [Bdellovibrionales bacterium]|nr:ATP-binding cassette domain-containing protein [Bdellovibrionales bacterium]